MYVEVKRDEPGIRIIVGSQFWRFRSITVENDYDLKNLREFIQERINAEYSQGVYDTQKEVKKALGIRDEV